VAIVQISRITARKGLVEDLPQPLAGAELGWATDERRLFIGNGTTAEGAPVVGNTEVLTEFSDILGFATAYTYEGQAGGYVVQTGPTVGSPITQSLQSRLDTYANVKDFGATGDGQTDDTDAINRALYQLYCVQNNPQTRRSLFFPAGEYIVTDSIKVPPYASLIGDGPNSSILNFFVDAWTSTIPYAAGVLVKNGSNYFRSLVPVPIGALLPSPPNSNTYWESTTLPEYVVRTADGNQNTGANISPTNTAPVDIEIDGIAITTNQINNGLLIEAATQCYFTHMVITGPYTTDDLYPTLNSNVVTDNIAAIKWAGAGSLACNQIIVDQCVMTGFTYGTTTDTAIKGVTLSNNYYNTLYKGLVLDTSPTGVRVMHSTFDAIYAEGIVIDGAAMNATGYNMFYDVGNHLFGTASPATVIVNFTSNNNISVGDMFQRTTAQSSVYPRVDLNETQSIGFTSAAKLEMGTYTRETGVVVLTADNASNVTLFTFSGLTTRAMKVDYTFVRGDNTETGVFKIVASTDGTGGDLATNNSDVLFNVDPGLTLAATETSNTVTVTYSTTSTGATGSLHYSITHLA
jgi:hypothetical protein